MVTHTHTSFVNAKWFANGDVKGDGCAIFEMVLQKSTRQQGGCCTMCYKTGRAKKRNRGTSMTCTIAIGNVRRKKGYACRQLLTDERNKDEER